MASSRSIIRFWQSQSSGVTDGWAIRSMASCSVADRLVMGKGVLGHLNQGRYDSKPLSGCRKTAGKKLIS